MLFFRNRKKISTETYSMNLTSFENNHSPLYNIIATACNGGGGDAIEKGQDHSNRMPNYSKIPHSASRF